MHIAPNATQGKYGGISGNILGYQGHDIDLGLYLIKKYEIDVPYISGGRVVLVASG